jgi:hypothetical protein
LKIKDLFDVKYGVNLELMTLETVSNSDLDGVNFVARTSINNGVVAKVRKIEGLEPQPAGVLSCAGGGSVLSAFVQTKPFYSGRDLYTLTPKKEMSLQEKLYYCMCIKANAYRYSYGRQANKTLKDIELPDIVPEWVYSIPVKPLETKNKSKKSPLRNLDTWDEFLLGDLFAIKASRDKNLFNSGDGGTPYVAASSENNGITSFVDTMPSQKSNTLTIARNGSVCSAFYHPIDYCSSPDDIRVLTPKFNMNVYTGLFIKTIVEREKFKYGYGRKLGTSRIKKLIIKLPATPLGSPDWDYMERYIKSLPYSDRL